jgi:hypothetical protein
VSNYVKIEMVQGTVAPRYSDGVELHLEKCVITEQGTESMLPLVDLVMQDPVGRRYLLVLNGRIVNGISAAIKGANTRNHGVAEP